ncbi:uncharacterized protein LOC134209070 [Armigeres subalbatus]|uniref:uncharacterized protein LOC134209070 n=1 Tax=Armigeres subalbatus TaxID=124917 RepID=UPI002ED23087
MFRQILVHPEHRNLQQIAWRQEECKPLKIYRLNTVTYGTSCAPYLSTRVLNQLSDDEGNDFPLAASIIKNDFYVDDLLAGANTIETLVEASTQLDGLLERDQTSLQLDRSDSIKTLGLLWFPVADEFGFKVPDLPPLQHVTKRIVLSEMSQLFDPLGLIGPVVASAKMFVQQLWQEKLTWDEELPETLRSWWLSFRASTNIIRDLRVPRWVFGENTTRFEMHCFVDASSKGYGACIYAVSDGPCTSRSCNLLIAKSRVAPVSGYSIPRLELCAAVLGSQLADHIRQNTRFNAKITFWSDSSIVLHWISSPPSSWKIFVSNRVAEVQKLSNGAQWRHVPTLENPADRISRGVQPEDIMHDALRWHGPKFLLDEPQSWPDPIILLSAFDVQQQSTEQRQTVTLLCITSDDSLIHDFSQLSHLLRIAAYCLRFLRNCQLPKHDRNVGSITPIEYDSTLKSLIRVAQGKDFQQELRLLHKHKEDPLALRKADYKSPLKDLDVWVDDSGLLRINGRLAQSRGSVLADSWQNFSSKDSSPLHDMYSISSTSKQPVHGTTTDELCYSHERRGASVKIWVAVYVCFAVKAVVLDIVAGLSTASCVNSLRRFVSRVGRVRTIHCDNSATFVGASREVKELRQVLVDQLKGIA